MQKTLGFQKVRKVIVADDASLSFQPADVTSTLIQSIVAKGGDYTHILSGTSAVAKDVLPRVAGLLDVQPLSDIIAIQDGETFVRPTYAGNALATVKCTEKVKIFTVRATNFDALKDKTNPIATVDNFAVSGLQTIANKVSFVSEEISKADRPELTSAKIVPAR